MSRAGALPPDLGSGDESSRLPLREPLKALPAGAREAAWSQVAQATAHWALGEVDQALACAGEAVRGADAVAEPKVQAAAHVAMALSVSLSGDPTTVEEEYARAAVLAADAGDSLQVARVQANRSHHLLADARFAEAVEVAAAAAGAAEELGCGRVQGAALVNEAEGLLRLGRYTEAVDRCERAVLLAGRIGTRHTAGALLGLGQIHLRHGAREQARAALEQALRLTEEEPDRQVRVPALSWLAVALLPGEVERASALAGQALAEASGSGVMPALLAAGRCASARGECVRARELAEQAVDHARRRRERTWLAEALELRAMLGEPGRARSALQEAQQIWQTTGAIHDADRVRLRLARLPSGTATERMAARLSSRRLRAAGVADVEGADLSAPAGRVRIATFGRFVVHVDEVAVAPEAWQSRQARELLRLLVCRRGRAVPRPEICEMFWPDDDPERTAHRLAVVLSTLRGVTGADAVLSDPSCVSLSSDRVEVDVERFLAEVADAVALQEHGEATAARVLLTEATGRYTDDPFADAPYDDVAADLREEARAAYLQALRLLAEDAGRAGDHDRCAAHLRRLLGQDRYDEAAHRALVAVLARSGRHGQARLATTRYRAAMADLGLRPAAVGVRAAV